MRSAAHALLLCLAACAAPALPGPGTPFGGAPHPIPGTVEAEHYDDGPAGVVYADVTPRNEGVAYRGETQVDIEGRPDASNKHGLGWTKAGEWVLYTVDVREAGTYVVEIPVASQKQGGVFRLEFGGVDRSGPIDVPDTGAWTKLKTIRKEGLRLEAGVQVMKLVCVSEGASKSIGDLDLFRFVRTGP